MSNKEYPVALLRIPSVLAETGYRSHASIYSAIKAGLFTAPVRLSLRSVGWPDYEIEAINKARVAGKSDDEIKHLVARLHIDRVALATSPGARP